MRTNGRLAEPGAYIEEVLKNRNALPTELDRQVEFGVCGVCKITQYCSTSGCYKAWEE